MLFIFFFIFFSSPFQFLVFFCQWDGKRLFLFSFCCCFNLFLLGTFSFVISSFMSASLFFLIIYKFCITFFAFGRWSCCFIRWEWFGSDLLLLPLLPFAAAAELKVNWCLKCCIEIALKTTQGVANEMFYFILEINLYSRQLGQSKFVLIF